MAKNKKTNIPDTSGKKVVINDNLISNDEDKRPIWTFRMIDKEGDFPFNVNKIKEDDNTDIIFTRMLEYSQMTWAEIRKITNSNGHTRNHYLSDDKGFSKEARSCIERLKLYDRRALIYSFGLNGKLRIIGIREDPYFHVIWYDPEHKFYPSKKK